MTFRRKFILAFLIATIIPVSFSGVLSIRTAGSEMLEKTADYQVKTTAVAAEAIDTHFREAVNFLKLSTELIPFEQFPPSDLKDALRIPYRQFDFINAVALLDARGRVLTEPIYEAATASGYRQALTAREVSDFLENISVKDTLINGFAFSDPYFCSRTDTSKMALAIAFPVRDGAEKWLLAVELSLLPIDERVRRLAPKNGQAVLVDSRRRVISPTRRGELFSKRPVVEQGFNEHQTLTRIYGIGDTQTMGVFSPIPFLEWGLVMEQPAQTALRSVHRIRNLTVLWTALGIVVAILGGLMLGRGISRPIIELSHKARQLAAGRFDTQIKVHSKDEVGQLAESFNDMSSQLKRRIEQLENLFNSSTRTLVAAVEAKDRYTAGHSERVTAYALVLCDKLSLGGRERSIVEISGLLHDVGKIGVPESILNKPGSLIPGEYNTIKHHPIQGYEIVKQIDHPDAEEVAIAVRTHHERWDGNGYPDRLKGTEISVVARILTVADAFDAMTSSRAYRKGLPPDEAIRRLNEAAGTQFDKAMVSAFTAAFDSGLLEHIYKSAKTVPPSSSL
jgi:HAMP domain-containing protein